MRQNFKCRNPERYASPEVENRWGIRRNRSRLYSHVERVKKRKVHPARPATEIMAFPARNQCVEYDRVNVRYGVFQTKKDQSWPSRSSHIFGFRPPGRASPA